MHAVHFDRQRLRHTVWVTLVAWLLALSAGVVNACMLTPQGAVGIAVEAHGEEGGRHPQHGSGPDSGRESCLKFCDDESSSLSKGKSPNLDPGVALLAGIARWNPIVPKTPGGTRLSQRQPAAQGPPLVIRFLRLTR